MCMRLPESAHPPQRALFVQCMELRWKATSSEPAMLSLEPCFRCASFACLDFDDSLVIVILKLKRNMAFYQMTP